MGPDARSSGMVVAGWSLGQAGSLHGVADGGDGIIDHYDSLPDPDRCRHLELCPAARGATEQPFVCGKDGHAIGRAWRQIGGSARSTVVMSGHGR